MKFWTDKQGNKLTFKEFMQRWKQGMKEVVVNMDMMKQVKQQMRFTWIMIIGLSLGFFVSLIKIKELWWLAIVLFGALGNTSIQLIALVQKKKMLEPFSIQEMFKGGNENEFIEK